MGMDPRLQRMVLNRGSLAGARDPTAAFIGRMVQVSKTAKTMPTLMLGPPKVPLQPGTLSTFDYMRGFGYITPMDGSDDVFFHVQSVTNGSNMDMVPGVQVMFEPGMNERNGKTKAVRVELAMAPDMGNGYGKAAPGGQDQRASPYGMGGAEGMGMAP